MVKPVIEPRSKGDSRRGFLATVMGGALALVAPLKFRPLSRPRANTVRFSTYDPGPLVDDAPLCKACGQRVAPPRHAGHGRILLYGNRDSEYVCGSCLVEAVVRTLGER